MKIYKRIVIDFKGNILKENSFEYVGSIASCKGGSAPPPPTAAETALTEKQTELLDQQVEQLERQNELMEEMWPSLKDYYEGQLEYSQLQLEAGKLLLPLQTELAEQGVELQSLQLDAIKSEIERHAALEPVLLEAMGYAKDESGNYVGVEGEQDPLLASLEERYTKTLAGEEGASPYLEKQLGDERAKLEEDLSRKLGPNWQSTTPGIQALSDFDTRADLLRTETQERAVSSAGSQYFGARGVMAGEKQQEISNISALMGGGTGVTNVPMPGGAGGAGVASGLMGGGGASSVSAGISDLRNYYQQQRYAPWLAKQGQQAGRSAAMMGGAMGGAQIGTMISPGVGTAVGAGVGLLAGYLLS